MENLKNLGEIYVNGSIINLNKASIEDLEHSVQNLEIEEKKVKNQIFSILESL